MSVYLHLNRADSESAEHLIASAADQIRNAGVPFAKALCCLWMHRGLLLLLLDALDEVQSDQRERCCAALEGTCERYPLMRFVLTCRTAVYASELTLLYTCAMNSTFGRLSDPPIPSCLGFRDARRKVSGPPLPHSDRAASNTHTRSQPTLIDNDRVDLLRYQ